jgi:hypothetical protein
MSKIQVDAIEQQTACGTTLTAGGGAGKTVVVDATTVTLGRCGGTVALASGASQTGFGRTGTVDWITTPKTTGTFTAVSGEGYFCNTSGGVITANLPAGVAGAIVSLADYAATWQTSNVTVTPNGTDKIGSLNQNAILNTEGQSVTFVFVDSTQGWINTMDSTSNVRGAIPFVAATGGTITCSGDYKIHTFTGPGTFTVTAAGTPAGSTTVDYMVVAGAGGAGGGYNSPTARGAGAGGAGGWRASSGTASGTYCAGPAPLTSPASALPVSVQGYPIAVGGGGVGGHSPLVAAPNAANGSNSSFSSITSTGGGFGGSSYTPSPRSNGNGGGSGGGGSAGGVGSTCGGPGNSPPVSPAQGTDGGGGNSGPNQGGHGGGGIGGVGATSGGSGGAAGGPGVSSSITASPVSYAGGGGGGGGTGTGSNPGSGGGGLGGNYPNGDGDAGTVNTGGGGGGGAGGSGTIGGAGGSGIVVIRYKFQ